MNVAAVYEEKYEHILMCLICRNQFDDFEHQPKFLACHHTFCKECLRECLRRSADDIECPSCKRITSVPAAGATALQTNFYVKYIQDLVQRPQSSAGAVIECGTHAGETVRYYCKECKVSICESCQNGEGSTCANHTTVLLALVTEEHHHSLHKSFTQAHALIEKKRVETGAILRALSEEKDEALTQIDKAMGQHVHTLQRRATLLKNNAIGIYNEQFGKLEKDLDEIATAKVCVESLRDYHEQKIGRENYQEIQNGVLDIDDVSKNVQLKINPVAKHVVFDGHMVQLILK